MYLFDTLDSYASQMKHKPQHILSLWRIFKSQTVHYHFSDVTKLSTRLIRTAASIWFEIWGCGIVDPVKNRIFSRQISEKFRFFSGNFTKKSIFPGKFLKNFDFFS